jgi:hypothetical protein
VSGMLAQYVRSEDPRVIESVEANWAARQVAIQKITEWATANGATGDRVRVFTAGLEISVAGIHLPEKPVGWVSAGDGAYRPGKRSPRYAEMAALTWKPLPVPGLPPYLSATSHDRSGSFWMLHPRPFVALGAAWVLLARQPDRESFASDSGFGEQWIEVKASEAHAAKESFEDAQRAVSA